MSDTPDPIGAILNRAADIIEERGWTRNRFENRGRVCASRALNLAVVEVGGLHIIEGFAARKRCEEVIRERMHATDGSWAPELVSYNDLWAKSRKTIVSLFREAATRN